MTEQEWMGSGDPNAMLTRIRGKASDRKLRLFACACVRQIWDKLTDPRSRNAVEVAERYAEGRATDEELSRAWDAAWDAARDAARDAAGNAARSKQADLLRDIAGHQHRRIGKWDSLTWCRGPVIPMATMIYEERDFASLPILADMLEENGCTEVLILNHLRGLEICHRRWEGVNPCGLMCCGDCRECHGEQFAPANLTHVRGCWALDLVLGKI